MLSYYVKRVLNIFREEGPVGLSKRSMTFLLGERIFILYTIKNKNISKLLYDAPAEPYKLIWVNPKQLNYYNKSVCKHCGLGQIVTDDLDKYKSTWDDSWRFNGLKQRYVDGLDWEETVYIENYKKKIETTGRASGCESIEEFIDVRCAYLDRCYNELKMNGYVTKESQKKNRKDILEKQTRKQWLDRWEPFASITRNGEIHVNEGFHRRALAEFAGVEKIPLNVLVRHKQWQELRDDIYNNELSIECGEELRNHPDLQDLLG